MTHEDPNRTKPPFVLPSQEEIVKVLREHHLIRLRVSPVRAFVVGSFAGGAPTDQSDVDVLLEIPPSKTETADEIENRYRRPLLEYFMKNDIRGVCDRVHPQWCGRRVDVYITFNADLESRPKVELSRAADLRTEPGMG